MNQITTDALLLKRINYGESDRILTLLTPSHGRVSLLAKGVRKSQSKLAGGLELFTVCSVTYIDSRSELKTAIATKLQHYYPNISKDIARTMLGYDMLKLLYRATHQDADTLHYGLLYAGIRGLDDVHLPLSVLNCWFIVKLLQIEGTSINLEKPLHAPAFLDTAMYNFSYEDMSFVEAVRGEYTPKHIKYLRVLASTDDPATMVRVTGGEAIAQSLIVVLQHIQGTHRA